MNIFYIFWNYFNKKYEEWFKPSPPPPRWRLVPYSDGTYYLEEWNNCIGMYLCVKSGVKDKAHAQRLIENLERENIYLK